MSESQLIEYKESWRDEYLKWICVFPEDWTADTIMQKHRSLLHNPDIAYTFYRAGFIESWGRGIEKIGTLCKEYGIVNDTVNSILALIRQNPSITYEELTEKAGKSRRTISRIIMELKSENILVRVCSDKIGH